MALKIALAFCALTLASPAAAAPFVNDQIGFAITVPDEFRAFDLALQDGMVVAMSSYEMDDYGEGRYQCAVSVTNPQNASTLSQDTITAAMVSPERQAFLAQTMSDRYAIESQITFDNGGVGGTEFMARLQQSDAESPYIYTVMMETASGRTTMSCSVEPAYLDAALPIYRHIRDTMVAATR